MPKIGAHCSLIKDGRQLLGFVLVAEYEYHSEEFARWLANDFTANVSNVSINHKKVVFSKNDYTSIAFCLQEEDEDDLLDLLTGSQSLAVYRESGLQTGFRMVVEGREYDGINYELQRCNPWRAT